MEAPPCLLEQAQRELVQEEEEHLSINQLQARRERVKPTKSIFPIVVVDSNGKATEVPINKSYKRKKSKPSLEETPKRQSYYLLSCPQRPPSYTSLFVSPCRIVCFSSKFITALYLSNSSFVVLSRIIEEEKKATPLPINLRSLTPSSKNRRRLPLQ